MIRQATRGNINRKAELLAIVAALATTLLSGLWIQRLTGDTSDRLRQIESQLNGIAQKQKAEAPAPYGTPTPASAPGGAPPSP